MIGLCYGLAVQAHVDVLTKMSNGVAQEWVDHNIRLRRRPVPFTRKDALSRASNGYRGESFRYYKLIDACPLRMS